MSRKLLQRYYKILGEEFDPETIELRKALRVNTLKTNSKDLKERLEERGVKLEAIPYLKDAFWFEAEFSLASTEEYLLGLFYIQEPASQLVSHVFLSDYKASDNKIKFLDMAAAPGSKTTHIAQLTNDKETIVAVDNNMSRITVLKNNIDRLGLQSILIYKKDSRFADDLEQTFDYVLLDAPCSGNFCVEERFFEKRSLQDVQTRVDLQKELLRSAHRVLNKNGVLVYSTCSLEPEEDEEMVDWFISEFEDMIVEKIDLEIGDAGITEFGRKSYSKEVAKTKRFWPHKTGLQGFYIAKLRKK